VICDIFLMFSDINSLRDWDVKGTYYDFALKAMFGDAQDEPLSGEELIRL